MEYFSILNFYFLIIVFLALLFPFLFLKFIHPILKKVIEKKNKNLFKNLVKLRFFYTLGYILSPLILLLTLNNTSMIGNDLEKFTYIIKKVSGIWIIVSLSILLNKLLTALNDTFKKNEFFIKYPVNSYLQLIKLIIVIITAIFSICYALNLSPWGILSGVGALGAILILVFKDTILGLIASIQVYGGKLLQEGDWIELKDLNIDGEVMEVGLHRVKVKAWDNTITTFPTAKFLEYTFKNWRGMQESGGRRIKRRIILSISSIKFVNEDFLKELSHLVLLKDYIKNKNMELKKANASLDNEDINRRSLTNLGCFRIYINNYLEKHPKIRQDMTLLVRQLPINQYGLPIEVYAFTNTTKWKEYEDIQSDIFDHILASIHHFELEAYQEPSSKDLKSLISNLK